MIGQGKDPVTQLAKNLQGALDKQAKRIAALESYVSSVSKYLSDSAKSRSASMSDDEYRKQEQHYTQVVMLGGYAGFFTLWTQTNDEMSLWLFASSGALITISLAFFVGFELYRSWRIGISVSDPSISPAELHRRVDDLNRLWKPFFVVSAGTGVTAGASLLFWFVYKSIVAAARLAGAA